jgi:hypothetical protein
VTALEHAFETVEFDFECEMDLDRNRVLKVQRQTVFRCWAEGKATVVERGHLGELMSVAVMGLEL